MKPIYIIIPHYYGEKWLANCIQSIIDNHYPHKHIVVVDNGSLKESVKAICARFEDVTLISNKTNLGFGVACNTGMSFAIKNGAKYIFFMNQDTILHPDALGLMVQALNSDNSNAIVAPMIYEYDGDSMEAGFVGSYVGQAPDLVKDAIEGSLKLFYHIDKICGACFGLKSETVAGLGLFDPLYFMYVEDEDLCRRIRLSGYNIALVTQAKVYHANSNNPTTVTNQIRLMKKESIIIFELKHPGRSFSRNILKVITNLATDQINLMIRLKLSESLRTMSIIMRIIPKIRRICLSRKREMALMKTDFLASFKKTHSWLAKNY